MMTVAIIILSIIGLILVHEFGHFIIAKAFGIRVEEFSIFFPPRLFSKKFGETKYTLGLLPVGGYVKIFGETPEEAGDARHFNKENFSHRSRWIQAAVIVAGIVFNVLTAWVLLSAAYMIGVPSPVEHDGFGTVQDAQVTIIDVKPDSPAQKAGIKVSDVVTGIDTGSETFHTQANAAELQQFISAHAEESMVISLKRGTQELHVLAKPTDGIIEGRKALGIALDDVGTLKLSPPLAVLEGGMRTIDYTILTTKGVGDLIGSAFKGEASLDEVKGPIGIVRYGAEVAHEGWYYGLLLVVLISINLAIINVFPIPGLDGGRLLFIAIEGITRRPLNEKWVTRVTVASFALIALLAIVITFNDVASWIHGA